MKGMKGFNIKNLSMKGIKGCYVKKINETGRITKNETDFKVHIRYVKMSIISQL